MWPFLVRRSFTADQIHVPMAMRAKTLAGLAPIFIDDP
jgi:hypothetical protein